MFSIFEFELFPFVSCLPFLCSLQESSGAAVDCISAFVLSVCRCISKFASAFLLLLSLIEILFFRKNKTRTQADTRTVNTNKQTWTIEIDKSKQTEKHELKQEKQAQTQIVKKIDISSTSCASFRKQHFLQFVNPNQVQMC